MNHLLDLIEALKDNLKPETGILLLDNFLKLDPGIQQEIIDGLELALERKKLIEEYQGKRKQLVNEVSKEIREIEKTILKKRNKALKEVEAQLGAEESKEVESLINQL